MKLFHLIAFTAILASCDSDTKITPKATAHKTGRNSSISTSETILSYGSHAIRVQGAPLIFRIYRIDDGNEALEHEFTLNPEQHDQAWVTPCIHDTRARIEFGAHEVKSKGKGSGGVEMKISWPEWVVTFDIPHTLGSGPSSVSISPDQEEVFLLYTLVEQEGVDMLDWESMSREVMVATSKDKAVSFYVVTVSPE